MYQKEIKTFIYLFIYLFIYSSCSKQTKHDDYIINRYSTYKGEYEIINDSLRYYVSSFLKDYTSEYMYKWEVDSFVCFNSEKDKLVTSINSSSGKCNGCKMDDATKLLGKKINGKWYFFKGGGTLVIPRDMYGKDEYHPLSFHELSQIARKEMFGENCLIKKMGNGL